MSTQNDYIILHFKIIPYFQRLFNTNVTYLSSTMLYNSRIYNTSTSKLLKVKI